MFRRRRWLLSPGWPLRFLLAALFLIFAAAAPAAGGEERRSDDERAEHGEGLALFVDDQWVDTLSMDTRVQMQVHGLFAEVSVRQTFVNGSAEWREGRYLLPLPEDAAVGALTMRIGNRLVEGEVREKEEAKAAYVAAVAAGQRAGLVSQNRPNLFQTAVGNIGPGETVEIEVRYWQPVQYRDDMFSLVLPLTLTPRYSPAAPAPETSFAMTPVADRRDATASTRHGTGDPEALPAATPGDEGSALPPTVELYAEIDAGVPLREVASPSHPIETWQEGGLHRVRLANLVEGSDRDFVLRWTPVPSKAPRSALFVDRVAGEDFALLMLVPPTLPEAPLPRELILVIDNSGSMAGASMTQAIEAADRALARLRPGDRFNVIRFDDTLDMLFPEAVPVQRDHVARARAFVRALRAEGGTEMLPALRAAFAGRAPAGFLRQVVLATDAAVSNEDDLLALIETGRGESRLFPVGIGSAPNGHFLREAAAAGRGTQTLIRDVGEVTERMDTLLAKLDRPAMRDVQVDWPGGAEMYPSRVPDLYAGEALQVVARLERVDGTVTVRGLRPQPWVRQLELAGDDAAPSPGVGRLWARARIDSLEDELRRGGALEQLRPAIVDTALRHGLVSTYTSLVAVDRTPARPQDAALASTRVMNSSPIDTVALAQGSLGWLHELLLAVLFALVSILLLRSRG
jgi:Ca-activated chloride channel family protein